MLFKFTGQYTGGRDAINACGIVFTGREPAEVTDADALRRLSGHPEFEAVTAAKISIEAEPMNIPAPAKRRGRKPKV
jgi:hypothetical protein